MLQHLRTHLLHNLWSVHGDVGKSKDTQKIAQTPSMDNKASHKFQILVSPLVENGSKSPGTIPKRNIKLDWNFYTSELSLV